MLNLKVIGAGAAGNKAAISLIKAGFNSKDVSLINSTSKDIDDEFKNNAIIFGTNSPLGGCGKERSLGKKLILSDLKTKSIDIDTIADPTTNAIVIVSSTEGGSGSAVTPILAKYIKEVIGIPVIVVLFFGFNNDARGMQNSIEILQELSDDYTIIGICNSKYLDSTNNNRLKAESLANETFVNIIEILTGRNIKPSSQNIDDTDLYKIITTPGYMMVESVSVSKSKNIEQISKTINSTIDDSKLMDCNNPGAKRIGVVYDIQNSISEFIDYGASDIIARYGVPYEMFTHVQEGDSNTITWIVSGLPMPIDEVKEIYDNYIKSSSSVNKKKDNFFDMVSEMKGNQEDAMFNMLSKNSGVKSKSSFFADFEDDDTPKKSIKKSQSTEEY